MLKLLITRNKNEARWLAEELETENKFRQELERGILKETLVRIERNKLYERQRGIIIHSHNWHPGLVGIIASRLVEKYSKPAIVLTIENDLAKGSARSIPSFDIFSCLQYCSDILIEFGGHKYAAGLKLYARNIPYLKKRFQEYLTDTLQMNNLLPNFPSMHMLSPMRLEKIFCTI